MHCFLCRVQYNKCLKFSCIDHSATSILQMSEIKVQIQVLVKTAHNIYVTSDFRNASTLPLSAETFL